MPFDLESLEQPHKFVLGDRFTARATIGGTVPWGTAGTVPLAPSALAPYLLHHLPHLSDESLKLFCCIKVDSAPGSRTELHALPNRLMQLR